MGLVMDNGGVAAMHDRPVVMQKTVIDGPDEVVSDALTVRTSNVNKQSPPAKMNHQQSPPEEPVEPNCGGHFKFLDALCGGDLKQVDDSHN